MTLLRGGRRSAAGKARERIGYEDDTYSWALQQAELLRAGRFEELDLSNLADEIGDVARREYDKLQSALTRVLQHLLKWDHQPERRGRSWALSIEAHRGLIADQLADHPGLKGMLDRALTRAYRTARLEALSETGLPRDALPGELPYSWDEIMNREIVWPEA